MINNQKICIAGKNNIAINICNYILNNYKDLEVVVIFNSNDNGINGFQRSFKAYASSLNLKEVYLKEVYDIENLIFISLEFDKIIKPEKFKSKKLFNIHFSYLPEYKGMYTSALPILYKENYTGVTFHFIDKGIDTGDIIEQEKIYIDDELTCENLYKKYIDTGSKLVIKNLDNILKGEIKGTIQSAIKSSYFSKRTIDYSNIQIDLNNTAYSIKRQINAFVFPSYQLPEVSDNYIYKTIILKSKSNQKPGTLISDTKFYVEIATIDFDIRLYKDLRSELFEMARLNKLDNLIEFINAGYDIFQRSKEGWDIAIISAYNSQYEFLEFLINDCNWDINTKNNNGTTLLMYLMTAASKNNDIKYLTEFLNKYNPDINIVDYYGFSVKDYAVKYENNLAIHLLNNN